MQRGQGRIIFRLRTGCRTYHHAVVQRISSLRSVNGCQSTNLTVWATHLGSTQCQKRKSKDFLVLSLTAEGQQRWDTAQKLMESVMHAATLVTIPREASLPSSLQEPPQSIGFCAAGKMEIPSPFPAAASFKEWLEDHVPMLRGGVCSHVAWEFPLSKQETRLLLLLSLMSEGQTWSFTNGFP